MAVIRQANLLSQQRIDVPHLRALESAVAADFDVLAGRSWAGEEALILRGLTLSNIASLAPATGLQLATADAIVFNVQGTEAGTFLWVPADRAIETLNPVTNSRITGGWTPGGGSDTVNYVAIDFVRSSDSTTTDLVQFLDANTLLETPKQVPLARTLDYRIIISTIPFGGQPNLIPIAKVTLNSSAQITAVSDARPMAFRLASGGDNPNKYDFFTNWTRKENYGSVDSTLFTGGDKAISSLKQWQDAVMTRIWESAGGEFWYSATADRNVQLVTYGSPLANGEYFDWNLGTQTLTFQNLRLLFDNSTSYSANIANGTVVPLLPGECLYVDVDRTQFYAPQWLTATGYIVGDLVVNIGNAYECTVAGTSGPGPNSPGGTAIPDNTVTWKWVGPGVAGSLTAAKANLAALGTGTPPGARWILAWRRGTEIFTRGWRYPVGTTFQPATTTSMGMVKLNQTAGAPLAPVVVSIMANGRFEVTASGGNAIAGTVIGNGSGAGLSGSGGATDGSIGVIGTSLATNGHGVRGDATGTGSGVIGRRGGVTPGANAAIAGRAETGYGLYIEGETAAYIKGLKSPGFTFEVLAANGTVGGGSQGGTGGKFTGGNGTTGTASPWNGGGGLQIIGGNASSGTNIVGTTGGGAVFTQGGVGSDGNGETGIGTGRAGGGGGYGAWIFGGGGGNGANGTNLGGNGGPGAFGLTVTGGAGGTAGGGPSSGTDGAGGDALIATAGAGGLSGGRGAVITGGNGAGGHGAIITGGTAGKGVVATAGGGNNQGVDATGAGTAAGVKATGGGSGGQGVDAIGTGTVEGVKATAGTASTGASPRNAIDCTNGNIVLSGGVDPNAGVGITDTVTPKNICKMWADITVPSADGNCTLNDGFNVGTPTVAASDDIIVIPIVNDMAGNNYAVSVLNQDNGASTTYFWYIYDKSASQVKIKGKFWNGSAIADAALGTGGQDVRILVTVIGAQ